MTPDTNTPVIAYLRVSTDEQGDSGAGLDAQEHAIRAACEARGWRLVHIHQDVASGATTARRPGLHAALASLEAPDGPQAIVVAKLDRLTRSVADAARLFERSKDKGWGIVVLDLGVDTTTPAGELVANVMVAVGQWERRVIAERTRDALAARKRAGVKLGRPRTMPQATINQLHELRDAGLSLRRVAAALNEKGIRGSQGGRWTDMTVRDALRRYPKNAEAAKPPAGNPDELAVVLAHADALDKRADDLEQAHEVFLADAARYLRDSWDAAAERNYGSILNNGMGGAARGDNPYAFNGGNGNSWHYVDGKRRHLGQYREFYLEWVRGSDETLDAPAGTPEPPAEILDDLQKATDLRLAAGAHRRHVAILRGEDDWAYDDEDRAIARERVDSLLASLV